MNSNLNSYLYQALLVSVFILSITNANAATISNATVSSDVQNITFKYNYSGSISLFQAYVDTDSKTATGMISGTVGADYLLKGNTLLKFNGTAFVVVKTITFTNSGGVAKWTVSRADLGKPILLDYVGKLKDLSGVQSTSNTVSNYKLTSPGHYIAAPGVVGDIRTKYWFCAGGKSIIDYAKEPGVKGLQLRYYWKDLERDFAGDYHFEDIIRDLELLKAINKRLIIMVMDKSFTDMKPTPAYFRDEYVIQTDPRNRETIAWVAKRWDPYVVKRYTLLFEALAKVIDGHVALEGVAMPESAMSLADKAGDGYDADLYAAALDTVVKSAQNSFKRTPFFWYQNALNAYGSNLTQKQLVLNLIDGFMATVKPAIGGPDVVPDRSSADNLLTPVYTHMIDNYGRNMNRFCSMQNDSYRHHHGDDESKPLWSMRELFDFASSNPSVYPNAAHGTGYDCNYVIWNIKEDNASTENVTTPDAIDVINRFPNF